MGEVKGYLIDHLFYDPPTRPLRESVSRMAYTSG